MSIITETGVKLPDIPAELFADGSYAVVYETTTMGDDKRYWFAFSFSNELAYIPKEVAEASGVVEAGMPAVDYICPQNAFASIGGAMMYDPQTNSWCPPPDDLANSGTLMFLCLVFEHTNDGYTGNFVAWTNSDIKKATSADFENFVFETGSEVAIYATPSNLEEKEYRVSKLQIQPLADVARKVSGTSGGKDISTIASEIGAVVPMGPALNEINEFTSSNEGFSIALNIDDKTRVLEDIMVPDVMVDLIDTVVCLNLIEMPDQFLQAGGTYTATNLNPKYVYLPVVNKVTYSAFTAQARLEKVVAPKATYIDDAFGGTWMQGNLIEIPRDWFPEALEIGYQTFDYFESLVRADFQKAVKMTSNSFGYCPKLKAVVFRNANEIAKSNWSFSSTFKNTPLASGKGVFIVPSSLVSDYKSYWDDMPKANSQIIAIEDYSVDGTLDGDIDWPKVDAYIATL